MNCPFDLLSPLRDQPDQLITIILEQARLLESLLRQKTQWEQEKAQAVAALQFAREELRQKNQEILQLSQHLEEAQRAAHRQAAPFRRPEHQRGNQPGRPGRQPGHPAAVRPKPAHIDHHERVPLPACPRCQGPLSDRRALTQDIEELPPVRPDAPDVITEEGWCENCQQTVRWTQSLQVSSPYGVVRARL